MTLSDQLRTSATHLKGLDRNCPKCNKQFVEASRLRVAWLAALRRANEAFYSRMDAGEPIDAETDRLITEASAAKDRYEEAKRAAGHVRWLLRGCR